MTTTTRTDATSEQCGTLPNKLKSYNKLPVWIVEDHNEVRRYYIPRNLIEKDQDIF